MSEINGFYKKKVWDLNNLSVKKSKYKTNKNINR